MSNEFLKKVMVSTKVVISGEQDYFKKVFDSHKMNEIEFKIEKGENGNSILKVVLFKDKINNPKVKTFKDNKDKMLEALNYSTQFDIVSNDWFIIEDENEFQASIEFKPKTSNGSDEESLSKYDTDAYGDEFDKAYSKAKEGSLTRKKIINFRYDRDLLQDLTKELEKLNINFIVDDTGEMYGGYGKDKRYPNIKIPIPSYNSYLKRWTIPLTIIPVQSIDSTTIKEFQVMIPDGAELYITNKEPSGITIDGGVHPSASQIDTALKKWIKTYYIPCFTEAQTYIKDLKVPEEVKDIQALDFQKLARKLGGAIYKTDEAWYVISANDAGTLEDLEFPEVLNKDLVFSQTKNLRSFKGCSQRALKDVYVYGDTIMVNSLEGLPKEIVGNLSLEDFEFKSFRGLPEKVNGDLIIDLDTLTLEDLQFLPEFIGGTLKFYEYMPLWENQRTEVQNLVQDMIKAKLITLKGKLESYS